VHVARNARTAALGGSAALAYVAVVALCATVRAQALDPGQGGSAQPDFAGTPLLRVREQGRAVVAGGLRYGYTEDVLGAADSHHRIGLGLAGSYALVPWAELGATFDMRYDAHSGGPDGGDSGGLGQSRLSARADQEIVPGTRLGAELALRVPPAQDFGAGAASLGGELLAVATQRLAARALVTGALGYRLDRSSEGIADAARLSASDRTALGASDSNALLLAVASAYDAGPVVVLLGFGWDVLVGSRAPGALESPLRLSLGARRELLQSLWLEGLASFTLSQRPDPAAKELVPIEPRVLLGASVSYGFGGASARGVPATPPPPPLPPPPPQRGTLHGQVVDTEGAPVPDARVVVASLGRELTSDAEGRFSLDELPLGPLDIYTQAPQWQPVTLRVEVAPGAADVRIALVERLPLGQIRGTVRGKFAAPVAAQITVAPLGTVLRAGEDGTFVVDVAPGEYEVTITAPGYETQRREVEVEHNGVTVLLVDLRSAQ